MSELSPRADRVNHPPLYHFYHLYADGDWETPVSEHISALQQTGLYDELSTIFVGFIGSARNVNAARRFLDERIVWERAVVRRIGFEQETLEHMWQFSQAHGGFGSYAHTKGAANFAKINDRWRRSMEWYNFVGWQACVAQLEAGATAVGCHWIHGNPTIERLSEAWKNRQLNPPGHDGVGGMYGGNYWWVRLDALRQNCRPSREHRHAAEHWLGQLSDVMPVNADTFHDLNPRPIVPSNLYDWVPS